MKNRTILAVLGNADVKDEELMAAFTGAESMMNFRPFTYQSAYPHEYTFNPNHFLLACGQFAPEVDKELNSNPTKRWRKVQELVRHVWHRWTRE